MMLHRRKNRGAALLMAMLTVTLVATFASAAMWQQWRGVEVEQAERARVQSGWILTGALDWARLILNEDNKATGAAGKADYLSEPWAVPLQEAKLSAFLAAEKGVTTVASGDDSLEAFLSGEIVDLQSKLNVRNLLQTNGLISEPGRISFSRLFETLGLPPAQLDTLVTNLRFAADLSPENRSGPMAPLMPQRVDQLVWLGLAPETVAALQPFVTLLPESANKVNINTASAEVIYASVDGLSMADAQMLVAERARSHFSTVGDASKVVSSSVKAAFDSGPVSVQSSYFESRGRLRLDAITVEERSVIQRNVGSVKALVRERGVVDSAPPAMPLPAR